MKKKTTIFITALAIVLFAVTAFALDSLIIRRNDRNDQTFAIKQGHINTFVLTANTAKSISAHVAGARYAIFAATADIWVTISGSAAIPTTTQITDGTGAELNPSIRFIEGATYISIISEYAAKVSVMFYK